jgi:acyl-coenzyme A thioesterase PaaI-like protein
MHPLPHTRSCFVCGEANPIGLRLRFQTDGRVVCAEFKPCPEHSGFQEVVHGGIISTVLDEIMVWACAVQTRQFGYCAELTVRFQQPLRPGELAIATAELVSNRRNRIFEAKAQIDNSAGVTAATATGKYLPIGPVRREQLLAEFIGDIGWFDSAQAEEGKGHD